MAFLRPWTLSESKKDKSLPCACLPGILSDPCSGGWETKKKVPWLHSSREREKGLYLLTMSVSLKERWITAKWHFIFSNSFPVQIKVTKHMKIAPRDSHQLFRILVTKLDDWLSIRHWAHIQFILAINKIQSSSGSECDCYFSLLADNSQKGTSCVLDLMEAASGTTLKPSFLILPHLENIGCTRCVRQSCNSHEEFINTKICKMKDVKGWNLII